MHCATVLKNMHDQLPFFFRFCGMCSSQLRKGVKYCWNCNADQTTSGPPSSPSVAAESGRAGTSFGRPQTDGTTGQKRKAMSLNSYMKTKSSEQQSGSAFRSKKKVNKDDNKEVIINIGLKQLCEVGLKTIRGKRLPLRVPQSATYAMLLEKAVQKWSAFDKKFDGSQNYVLLFEDETHAQFMPGKFY